MATSTRTLPETGDLVYGTGPERIIALHGWIADRQLLAPLMASLDHDRFSVAVPDCRGYGSRFAESGAMSMSGIAEDALQLASRLGWDRFGLLGHSMGGLVAQRLALAHPERIARLLLIAPVPVTGASLDAERRHLLEQAVSVPHSRGRLIGANTSDTLSISDLDALTALSLETASQPALLAYMRSWSSPVAIAAPPSPVACRVLMGSLDPGARPERFDEVFSARFSRAELTVLPRCGHYPMWEDAAATRRWMSAADADD